MINAMLMWYERKDIEPTEKQDEILCKLMKAETEWLRKDIERIQREYDMAALACYSMTKAAGFEDLNYAPDNIKYLDIPGYREEDIGGEDIEEVYEGLKEKFLRAG